MSHSVYRKRVLVLLIIAGLFGGCASMVSDTSRHSSDFRKTTPQSGKAYNKPYKVKGITYYPLPSASGYREVGTASWYGSESGNRTAMGTHFVPHGLTAAHRTLPLPTKIRVTNLHNGRHVDVVVNDRGPFKHDRIIDLSKGAAKKIGLQGLAKVKIEYLDDKISQND